MTAIRTGLGWDNHRIAEGRPMILGGITVPCEFGLDGHSDADILLHALTDALLGALALGDIGMHFPDTDPQWKGADTGSRTARFAPAARHRSAARSTSRTTAISSRSSRKSA